MNRITLLLIPAVSVLTLSALTTPVGEASCLPPPTPCPCDQGHGLGENILRGSLVEVGSSARVEVLEVLRAQDEIAVGDVLGGTWSETLPCGEEEASLEVGQEVLLYFRPNRPEYGDCAAYRACTNAECGELRGASSGAWDQCDGQCVTDTAAECEAAAPDPFQTGELQMTAWRDTLDLGDGFELESSAWAITFPQTSEAVEACHEVWPRVEAPPCNDVIDATDESSCAMASPTTRGPLTPWLLLGIAVPLCFAYLRRR